MKYLFGAIFIALSVFSSWLAWGPMYQFLASLIPSTAQYAWAGKLLCLVLVGVCGGIGIPLMLFLVGAMLIVKDV